MASPGADWLGIGALAMSGVMAVYAVLKKSPISSASRFDAIRAELADIREAHRDCIEENKRLEARIASLESQISILRGDALFWQEQWRKLAESNGHKAKA